MMLALEPATFLRRTPPFDQLEAPAFERVERAIEIAAFPRGTKLLAQKGLPSRYLNVIRKGLVRFIRDGQVIMTLEEGEIFGYVSILSGTPPYDVTVEEDVVLYRIPEAVFVGLLQESAFARHFTLGLATRLRNALEKPGGPLLAADLHEPVERLLTRPALFVSPEATVGEAVRLMSAAGTSSILVETDPTGILTDRDLRNRVLAAGRGPETPVGTISSSPLVTIDGSAPLYDAWQVLLEKRVHHLPVILGGRIAGVVTDTDLLRQQSHGPVAVFKHVERMPDRASLRGYATAVARMARNLFDGGLDLAAIGRLVARTNDALLHRILAWAEAELGPPPCAYSWISYGSEGRMEQILLTDQDNGLVYESAEASAYFEKLAGIVVSNLVSAGFPPCREGYMATERLGPLDKWKSDFRRWISSPRPETVVESAHIFDYRPVHGTLDLSRLEEEVQAAQGNGEFLAHLVDQALVFRPPVGPFGRLREDGGGVDLKHSGLMPIVGLARLLAIDSGSRQRNTLERLSAAVAAGKLSAEAGETVSEAFRFFLRLRLRLQSDAALSGRVPTERVAVDSLSSLDRAHLKEAFRAVMEFQEIVSARYSKSRHW